MSDVMKTIAVGTDWLTVTSVTGDMSHELVKAGHKIRDTLLPEGKVVKDWSSMGYRGASYGPLKYGVRKENEAILIVSGELAEMSSQVVKIPAHRVTRLDLQVTVAPDIPLPFLVAELRKVLPNLPEFSKYAKMMTYISSATGDTLYVGKRGRSSMLRIYDKSLDLGYSKLGSVWRYEMEYRREAAKTVCDRVEKAPDRAAYILRQVLGELAARGIKSSFAGGRPIGAIEVSSKISTTDTQLSWLSRCVTPVIIRLLNAGYEEEVLSTLKLKNIVKRQALNERKRNL